MSTFRENAKPAEAERIYIYLLQACREFFNQADDDHYPPALVMMIEYAIVDAEDIPDDDPIVKQFWESYEEDIKRRFKYKSYAIKGRPT